MQRERWHRWSRNIGVGHLYPLRFTHLTDGQAQVGRVSRSPRTAKPQPVAFEPLAVGHVSGALGIAGRVAIVATGDLDEIAAVLHPRVVRTLRIQATAR